MIELWHEWNSVQSFKVRVVLAEKDLQWTARRVDLLKFEQLQSDYLHLNPNGVVSVLMDLLMLWTTGRECGSMPHWGGASAAERYARLAQARLGRA